MRRARDASHCNRTERLTIHGTEYKTPSYARCLFLLGGRHALTRASHYWDAGVVVVWCVAVSYARVSAIGLLAGHIEPAGSPRIMSLPPTGPVTTKGEQSIHDVCNFPNIFFHRPHAL